MKNIYTAIITLGAIVTTIYNIWKWLKENKDNNKNNNIRIWIESLRISFPIIGCVLPFIVLVYVTNVNQGIFYDILFISYVSILSIAIIIGCFVFFIKERYKDKYGDIIHQDCLKYSKENEHANNTINSIHLKIGRNVLDKDFNYKKDLEHAKQIYQTKPKLHSITKKYNKLCQQSWLSVAALNGILILSLFESSDGNVLAYVGSSIIVTFIIFLLNTLNIYSDLRIKYGKRNSTITKIKKHEKVYDELLKENEESK